MLSFVGRGGGLSPYFKASSYAVGNKVLGAAVELTEKVPSIPSEPTIIDASKVQLVTRSLKAVSGAVNAKNQVRFAHTDIQIPDFSSYRRSSTKDPAKKSSDSVDSRRAFTYLMTTGAGVGGVVVAKSTITTLVGTMAPSKDVLALAKIEVNLSEIPLGKNLVVKWRGKPLFIRHRTADEISKEQATDVSTLRDPEPDDKRVQNPEWLIVIGVCTHLGCVPISNQGDYGGYYCPCHGSHYDSSGRIRKGPAPLNLEVPPYEFNGDIVVVG